MQTSALCVSGAGTGKGTGKGARNRYQRFGTGKGGPEKVPGTDISVLGAFPSSPRQTARAAPLSRLSHRHDKTRGVFSRNRSRAWRFLTRIRAWPHVPTSISIPSRRESHRFPKPFLAAKRSVWFADRGSLHAGV